MISSNFSKLNITEKLKKKILNDIESFLRKNNIEKVIIGFSGGMDSTVASLLCSEILGWDSVELVHVHFGIFTYEKTIHNLKKFGERMKKNIIFLNGFDDQMKIWKHGPSCNLCTKKVKMGKLKEYADKLNTKVIISGANKSDSWGMYGLQFHNGIYSPLFHLNKDEIYSLLIHYGFNLNDVKIGEKFSLSREGCKLKHLLKMLVSVDYHGKPVSYSNEILLKILEKNDFHANIANVKIIGPLSKNIALINLKPQPPAYIKNEIIDEIGKIKDINDVWFVEKDIRLFVVANPGLINNEKSRRMIEMGKFKLEFSSDVEIIWKESKNKKLWTYHVVDFDWR